MATLSPREILDIALRAGFSRDHEEAVIATAIALAESGGNPRAHNPVRPDNSFGLWQINMIDALGPDRRKKLGLSRNEELFDPSTNARAARLVFLEANKKFRPWTTFTGGRFKDHMGAARQAAALVDLGPQPGPGPQPEPDLTADELLDALESDRGQRILRRAVTHVLRVATGPDDGSQPASRYFDGLKADVKAIREKVEQLPG
jgi:Lysozyme like domain